MLYPLDYSDKPNNINFDELKLDPTAFVINVSRYREFFDWLMRVKFSENVIEKIQSAFKVHCEYVKNRIEHYVFSQRYPHFVLPLHQTDLIYNVIKRSVGEIVYSSDFLLERKKKNNTSSPEKTINRFYENIRKELHREDEVYTNENRSITYEEQFLSCPVVQHFLYLPEKNRNKICEITVCDGGKTSDSPKPLAADLNATIDFEISGVKKKIAFHAESKTKVTDNSAKENPTK